jgi:hypothetical protein
VIALKQFFLCVSGLKGVALKKFQVFHQEEKDFSIQHFSAEDFKIIRVARFLFGLNKNLFQRSSTFLFYSRMFLLFGKQ